MNDIHNIAPSHKNLMAFCPKCEYLFNTASLSGHILRCKTSTHQQEMGMKRKKRSMLNYLISLITPSVKIAKTSKKY